MDYYFCPAEELRQELRRRGYVPNGGQDDLSETLKKDDEARGTDATTLQTLGTAQMGALSKLRIINFPNAINPSILVGEKIIHWNLNTFFPTLQLFFESGLSCTFEGGFRQSAAVGLERNLRFRLTDLTHEEDGCVIKSTLPQKGPGSMRSIKILEAIIAERTSIAVQQPFGLEMNGFTNGVGGLHSPLRPRSSSRPTKCIGMETHVVIGLRLEGMQKMGFVWAKIGTPGTSTLDMTWADVKVVGLRNDVPAPFFGFPQKETKMGASVDVVKKYSMMNGVKQNGGGHFPQPESPSARHW